jgi:hypothetical protein
MATTLSLLFGSALSSGVDDLSVVCVVLIGNSVVGDVGVGVNCKLLFCVCELRVSHTAERHLMTNEWWMS